MSFRRLVTVVVDGVLLLGAGVCAFLLRFDGELPWRYFRLYLFTVPVLLPVKLMVLARFGLYRTVWKYASVREGFSVVGACAVGSLLSVLALFFIPIRFPRSIPILEWGLSAGLIGLSRLIFRAVAEGGVNNASIGLRGLPWPRSARHGSQPQRRVLLIGAGDAGNLIVREMLRHPELNCHVVGFVDDDPGKQGCTVHGFRVLGTRERLPAVVERYGINEFLIAMPSASGAVVRDIVQAAESLGVRVRTVPALYELLGEALTVRHIRDLRIEDLLGREEVCLDIEAIAGYLTGRWVLVTGAGGSIGSELCRQIICFRPAGLIMLDHAEGALYEVDRELRAKPGEVRMAAIVADVGDRARVQQVFSSRRPGVVFHAAAYKHVPLMELNPEEAVRTNALGTRNVMECAQESGVEKFVLISTDKAVQPSSIMGASKRVAELLVSALDGGGPTKLIAVRFGNVVGSRGSVVPLFQEQIAKGGPVTVTHPEMMRFFMTIPEAVQLVIQAGAMGAGGELFVLDMGKPVRIADLANDLIRLSGYRPGIDIEIQYIGARPGEKLHEQLTYPDEELIPTDHPKIFRIRNKCPTRVDREYIEGLWGILAVFLNSAATASPELTERARSRLLGLLQD